MHFTQWTSLIKVGVSLTYNKVLRVRKDISRFIYFQSKKEGVLIQIHFSKDDAFDGFGHSDRSSLSEKFSHHYTVMTLFQVKPETTW